METGSITKNAGLTFYVVLDILATGIIFAEI